MFDKPSRGGGIHHVADCLNVYLVRSDRDDARLIEYAKLLGNGTVFNRLGFLIENHREAGNLLQYCQKYLTKGYAKLEPTLA